MVVNNRWWASFMDGRDEEWFASDCASKLADLSPHLKHGGNLDDSTIALSSLHRQKYIGEILLNEFDIGLAEAEVSRILALEVPPPAEDRLGLKIYNLGKAVDFLFPLDHYVLYDQTLDQISVEGIKEVHRIAMAGLLDSAGVFRTSEAAPAGYAMYYYKSPRRIEKSLGSLCTETTARLSQARQEEAVYSAEHVKKVTAIASDFLGTFLDIHPFDNGNGRVGRLLVSSILREICIVPASLTVPTSRPCRDVFFDILQQARLHTQHNFSVLHSFVLEATHRTIAQLHCNGGLTVDR